MEGGEGRKRWKEDTGKFDGSVKSEGNISS